MNPIKKTYCRIFQFCFKIAIPILPYRTPKILNSVFDVPSVLKATDKVLIITDRMLSGSEIIAPLKNALSQSKIPYIIYDKTVPNPTIENVEEAVKIFKNENCSVLLGFGGGSSIDCAKGVGARIARPKKQIPKMEGILKILLKTPFTIAIPTTAGTGSETTVTTVITDGKTHHKFPISDFPLIPDVAVLDANLTKSLPKHLTSTTGMDALTHAVEAYIGNSTVKSTRKASIDALKLIFANLEEAYLNGDNLYARENMLKAAFYAGNAFSKSYVGYCHAVAHSLGGKYNIPHGLANAVIIPYTLEGYGKSAYKKLKQLSVATGLCEKSTPDEAAAKIFIDKIKMMNKNMDIPDKLSGIKKEDIPYLARYADKEANPLYPVPKLMNARELERLYYDVMEEEI